MVSHIGACGATFQRSKPFHTILQPTSTLVDPRSTFNWSGSCHWIRTSDQTNYELLSSMSYFQIMGPTLRDPNLPFDALLVHPSSYEDLLQFGAIFVVVGQSRFNCFFFPSKCF